MKPNTKHQSPITVRAFTLLEMAVVLLIIAAVMGSAIALFTASLAGKQYQVTVERMKIIDKALQDYWLANKRLPCPYASNEGVGAADFGRESAINTLGQCDNNIDLVDAGANAAGVSKGGVPVFTLGLPYEMAFDGWGRVIHYYISSQFTNPVFFLQTVALTPGVNTISIRNINSSAVDLATGVPYAIISAGPNGHGAYTGVAVAGGLILNTANNNAFELANCACDNAGNQNMSGFIDVPTRLYQGPETINSKTDVFDDILIFKTRAQLRGPTE